MKKRLNDRKNYLNAKTGVVDAGWCWECDYREENLENKITWEEWGGHWLRQTDLPIGQYDFINFKWVTKNFFRRSCKKMKALLVNFLLEHPELSWHLDGKSEEVLVKAIEEFFEKYPQDKE